MERKADKLTKTKKEIRFNEERQENLFLKEYTEMLLKLVWFL